ncbi:hypothetical protein IGI04_034216 [Brassica rapa subsp. trilocularis]|uniref:Uncharacterized protein n=2 Tax=Brassica campestris TaxID=3711 RepID=A0A3P5YCW5_BRACM|nr:hypothetical protein IGI04_034216 [Brassica rapa subsp. trilocularis]CAG7861080.1 unnamed protein product [Brassica rapa]VDC59480.1 unnamed protein product [Brassica rapa]
MGTRGDDEDEECFFDAPSDDVPQDFGFELWTNDPDSVSNRRRKFLQSMAFSFNKSTQDNDSSSSSSVSEDEELQPPSVPVSELVVNGSLKEDDSLLLSRNESTSSSSVFDRSSVSSSEETDDRSLIFSRNSSQGLSESSSSRSGSFRDDFTKKGAQFWLKKLGALTHVLESLDCESAATTSVQTYKKQFKELSSLRVDQDFSGHDGSILAMKFSPDGRYIASAGEDCVVRVWSVTEEERTDEYQVPVVDSGVYFGMNQHSQVEPLNINSEKKKKKTSSFLRKSSDSTCVVLPSKIFSISEKPMHEFRGHTGEILDLSWSDNGYLLSCSVDESVRLWRVGCDDCLGTFAHNNFVTCVAFNPVDDNYFISGSIDGKVRIWDVSRCRVVDYTDVRDIVTAVCYRPDAKAAAIGSITGNCRFYHILDNQLQMEREVSLTHGKKKVPSKRITGLEYFPNDSDKVMVTCADSQIRIICGEDVICKLKASGVCTTCASFTLDGKHIVSTTEDSGIHVWNNSQLPSKKPSSGKPKRIKSYESFISQNASVAIPWLRQANRNSLSDCITDMDKKIGKMDSCFSPMKGSTTWPEEQLDDDSTIVSSRGKKLKLLKNVLQPHMWGLVIVTATWDGRIRVFNNYGLPVRV